MRSLDDLLKQLDFILEIDRLKSVYRQTFILSGERTENDAEHSWHLAVMAFLLAEHADEEVDVPRVMKMVLIHDIVEIDAGDTFAYDSAGHRDKELREREAAERIFGLLPEGQRAQMLQIWREFEERETPEARFAAALDCLQPVLLNYHSRRAGRTWTDHDVQYRQVVERIERIRDGSGDLWEFARQLVRDAVQKGYLPEPDGS